MECHSVKAETVTAEKKVALVGNPNVGKSALFYALTGKYATISNYPGTTVDIAVAKLGDLEIIDTPGMHSLVPVTGEEEVARKLLEEADLVVHVVDAKNIRRALPFTLQLIEAGFNTILVLNLVDEAEKFGIFINEKLLEERLGIPVLKTVATEKRGVGRLKDEIRKRIGLKPEKKRLIRFSPQVEKVVSEVEGLIEGEYSISKRGLAILLLLKDSVSLEAVKREKNYPQILEKVSKSNLLPYEIMREIYENAERILDGVIEERDVESSIARKIGILALNPLFGIPLTILSLAFIYLLAGILGAQILVDLIETWFEENVNTAVNTFLEQNIPNYWLRELIGGEYGIITLGIRYAIAIIFPIVTTFFIAFSLLEDSGILPRTAYLLDGIFKKIGMSGRAVIPLLLGTGCGTMAVIVTRILETWRERVIATILLAVGIPCSAQLGVMLGIAPDFRAMMIWISVVTAVLLIAGFISSRVIPGERAVFFMEIPPIRVPRPENVFYKTVSRLEWYFKEVLPIFVLISVLIWIGRITTAFDIIVSALSVPVSAIGLPPKASEVFLYGFFRRDYGAAGLFDISSEGLLSYGQVVVAMVTLTLFVPCIAQFSIICKERGIKQGIAVFLLSVAIAFTAGYATAVMMGVV
ncbi:MULTISPECIES: ferrous iron transport protein B [Archaeoglobus]|uniref:Ferrous iron transport protein B n=2 Tax=Archaeoglobus fulgidus TaxID=2234 RepID=O29993_ARCFU|nr:MULTISPECIES: ferrous iron transport protein B [Archaeoglobus]AAB90987.1 iron (II) transporter (feoB-1) [Archaeoglobus fulgidus DSM 4304]AIG97062.1 ferrous iron transporter FeoB [Archaeoglobus fulgidus DSM 8774]MDI3498346.1 ferrous iron transport protein [Archaeoglobus sp.]